MATAGLWPRVAWRGRIAYRRALFEQRARREAVIGGRAPEAIWALEHPSTFTTGRRAVAGLPDPTVLRALGAELVLTERGGLATWHGPGQLVIYAILDLAARGLSVRALVAAIEEGLIAYLGALGLPAGRRVGAPGVWVGRDKVAALGLHVRHGVTLHGLALNLDCDLSAYEHIVPCGIVDGGVGSVRRLLGRAPSLPGAALELEPHLRRAIERARVDSAPSCR